MLFSQELVDFFFAYCWKTACLGEEYLDLRGSCRGCGHIDGSLRVEEVRLRAMRLRLDTTAASPLRDQQMRVQQRMVSSPC